MKSKKKICFVVSSPMTANAFLTEHILALIDIYSVTLICNLEQGQSLGKLDDKLEVISLAINRKVSLISDALALVKLTAHLNKQKYDAICSVTPKAGLISLLAGIFNRTPVRIHFFTGQVWVLKDGAKRWLLKVVDKLMAKLATDLLTDSPSQREFLISEGIVDAKKIQVLASGSICGVDLDRFKPSPMIRNSTRKKYEIPEDEIILLFMGRLNKDKGVFDLAKAFTKLVLKHKKIWLLMVGPDEESMHPKIKTICGAAIKKVKFVGYAEAPESFIAAADLLVLPSYREGFGSSVIEAAACGVPSVCSRIYGLTDAVVDGLTGLLHIPADLEDMTEKIEKLLLDENLRNQMGKAAQMRVVNEFSVQRLTGAMINFLDKRLA